MPLGPSADAVTHARDYLRKWSLGRYVASAAPTRGAAVLVLFAQDTVRDALLALARRGVLSAPVLDERAALFLGFFGVSDAVAHLLRGQPAYEELQLVRHQIGPEPGAPGNAALHAPPTPGVSGGGGGGGGGALPLFADQKLEALCPGADGHLLYNAADPGYDRMSLLDLVEGSFLHVGAPFWPTCHRVALCSNVSGVLAISAMVSQTDVVRFLLEHAPRGALGPLGSASLKDLGMVLSPDTLQPRGVECISGATPTLDAFGTMLSRDGSALGIVGEDGRLLANLSASDLRCVLPDRFGVLAQPVLRFLELEAAGGLGAPRRAGKLRGVVAVKADATLLDAMRAIVAHGLHHVFVVDDQHAPLAVVSTTDVLGLLVQN